MQDGAELAPRTYTDGTSAFHPLALELYDQRKQDAAMPLKFDFDDDGEVKNLANLTEAQKSADIKAVSSLQNPESNSDLSAGASELRGWGWGCRCKRSCTRCWWSSSATRRSGSRRARHR